MRSGRPNQREHERQASSGQTICPSAVPQTLALNCTCWVSMRDPFKSYEKATSSGGCK